MEDGGVCDVCQSFLQSYSIDPEYGLELRASLHHQGTPACLNHGGPIRCPHCDTQHVLFLENRCAKNSSSLTGDTLFRCCDFRIYSSPLHQVSRYCYGLTRLCTSYTPFFIRSICHVCPGRKPGHMITMSRTLVHDQSYPTRCPSITWQVVISGRRGRKNCATSYTECSHDPLRLSVVPLHCQ